MKKKWSLRALVLTLVAAFMLTGFTPAVAMAQEPGEEPQVALEGDASPQDAQTINVGFRLETVDTTLVPKQDMTITYRPLADYGLEVATEPGYITPLLALAQATFEYHGLEDPKDVAGMLTVSSSGYVTEIMGSNGSSGEATGYSWAFTVNNGFKVMPGELGNEYDMAQYPLDEGDAVAVLGIWEGSYLAGISPYTAHFTEEAMSAETGEPLTLSLKGYRFFDFPKKTLHGIANAEILAVYNPAVGAGADLTDANKTGVKTDSEGNAALVFDEAGTYRLSAYRTEIDKYDITRPYAVVTVAESDSGADAGIVAADKAALSLDLPESGVTQNLSLPAYGESGKTAITWQSSNTAVVSDAGVVTRPAIGAGDATVTLTATLKKAAAQDTKTFTVKVKALAYEEVLAALEDIAAAFGASYTAKESTDTNICSVFQKKADAAHTGSTVSILNSDNSQIDAETGAITYGAAQANQNVTFKVTLSGEAREVTVKVKVPAHQMTAQEYIQSVANKTTWDNIKKANTAADNVTGDLALTSETYCTVNWKITKNNDEDPDVLTFPYAGTGRVTRPAYGESDVTLTLTATVSANDHTGWFYAGTSTPVTGPSITITVPAYTKAEVDAAQKEVNEIAAAMKAGGHKITYMGDKTDADFSAIVNDLNLNPPKDYYIQNTGASISWTSDNEDALFINSLRGKVIRPGVSADDETGTLTATITKQGVSAKVEYPFTVKAVTRDEYYGRQ